MADPVTLAAIGAVAGAATNKKDPVKGALIGATLGFGGGSVAPALMGGTAGGAGALVQRHVAPGHPRRDRDDLARAPRPVRGLVALPR